ncbi:MAG: hypothetical protein Q9166_003846 [cf. Caloplaca sp. 2 TL-2023]
MEILLVNHQLYHTSLPILYGSNTFTTSSAATSYDFDVHLQLLPRSNRCLIRKVELEIDWGQQLWTKFPLVAIRLGELKGLRSLKLRFLEKVDGEEDTGVMVQGCKGGKRVVSRREGKVAELMLNAERKMLKSLVEGLKGLRYLELRGFADVEFARGLEVWAHDIPTWSAKRISQHCSWSM